MTPPDDKPEFAPEAAAEVDAPVDEAWLDELHRNPAYLKLLDEIDLDDTSPGVPAEEVRRWVESWGTDKELPVPKAG